MKIIVKQLHDGSERVEMFGRVMLVPEEYTIKDSNENIRIIGNIMRTKEGKYFYTVLFLDGNNKPVVFSENANTVEGALERIKEELENRTREKCFFERF